MAISTPTFIGGGNSTSSNTTFSFNTTAVITAGSQFGVISIGSDNINGGSNGDYNEIVSVTDTVGNTWQKAGEATLASQGAAGAGVTASIWFCRPATTIPSGSAITVTFASAIVSKAVRLYRFASTAAAIAVTPGTTPQRTYVTAANDWGGSATFSGLSSKERLYFRIGAKEGSSGTTITPTTNYTSIGVVTANSGTTATSVNLRGEFRILTDTGDTSSMTIAVAQDGAAVFVVLEEVTGQTVEIGLPSGTNTATAMGKAKAKAIGLVSSTHTAFSLGKAKAKAIGLATEAASALTPGKAKAKAVGLATEADTSFPVSEGVVSDETPVFRFGIYGPTVPAIDAGPDWLYISDAQAASPIELSGYSSWQYWDDLGATAFVHSSVDTSRYPASEAQKHWGQFNLTGSTNTVTVSGLDPGDYKVVVYAAEHWYAFTAAGQRVFTISVNGGSPTTVDLTGDFGQFYVGAIELPTTVDVSGEIDITFTNVIEAATWDSIEILLLAEGGGAIEVPIGLAAEADSTLTPGKAKARATGLTTSTHTAFAVSRSKAKAIGLAIENDTAQPDTEHKTRLLGLVLETDTAPAMRPLRRRAIGLATETDSAMVAGTSQSIGVATSTHTAFPVGKRKSKTIGLALETDFSIPFLVPVGSIAGQQKAPAKGLRIIPIQDPELNLTSLAQVSRQLKEAVELLQSYLKETR